MTVDLQAIVDRFFGHYPITTSYGAPAAFSGDPHYAVDIGTPFGTPLRAPSAGKVKGLTVDPIGGEQLDVQTPSGFQEIFAHLGEITIHQGEDVAPGELIAYTGASGQVTGPHLHFGVIDPQGQPTDPIAFLGGGNPGSGSSASPNCPEIPWYELLDLVVPFADQQTIAERIAARHNTTVECVKSSLYNAKIPNARDVPVLGGIGGAVADAGDQSKWAGMAVGLVIVLAVVAIAIMGIDKITD